MADKPRTASLERNTSESQISVTINLDGTGKADIDTDNGMLKHMLDAFARHGAFDLTVKAAGDHSMGWHHVLEDTGIVLGRVVNEALGDKTGIVRMAHAIVPLDEALSRVVIDISGRGYGVVDMGTPKYEGEFSSDEVRHFLEAFAIESRMALHATVLAGKNDHHRSEATFKALARALRAAVAVDERNPDAIPSTKGVID
ncbi:MAG: imidazoleglycerol-phosphate dehydratase HisB [Chloroflexi bacterium]|nr:imidazoleglycerol-phosphate dehydratase HisB [Chloroflexota bacterium]